MANKQSGRGRRGSRGDKMRVSLSLLHHSSKAGLQINLFLGFTNRMGNYCERKAECRGCMCVVFVFGYFPLSNVNDLL